MAEEPAREMSGLNLNAAPFVFAPWRRSASSTSSPGPSPRGGRGGAAEPRAGGRGGDARGGGRGDGKGGGRGGGRGGDRPRDGGRGGRGARGDPHADDGTASSRPNHQHRARGAASAPTPTRTPRPPRGGKGVRADFLLNFRTPEHEGVGGSGRGRGGRGGASGRGGGSGRGGVLAIAPRAKDRPPRRLPQGTLPPGQLSLPGGGLGGPEGQRDPDRSHGGLGRCRSSSRLAQGTSLPPRVFRRTPRVRAGDPVRPHLLFPVHRATRGDESARGRTRQVSDVFHAHPPRRIFARGVYDPSRRSREAKMRMSLLSRHRDSERAAPGARRRKGRPGAG